jgi:hypothetical protein
VVAVEEGLLAGRPVSRAPPGPGARRRRSTGQPNYRRFAIGQAVSDLGTWMQRLAQAWLVLTLSHSNEAALGVVIALQFGTQTLLAPWGGVFVDRHDTRRVVWVRFPP